MYLLVEIEVERGVGVLGCLDLEVVSLGKERRKNRGRKVSK
jgi:hypothetical protein